MNNLRIYKDIEIDDVYLITSFTNGNNTSFGIVVKTDDKWQLEIPPTDFTVNLDLEDLYKITGFVEHLDETQPIIKKTQFPDWKQAPEWATYAAMDEGGDWYWFETRPCFNSILDEWDAPNQTRLHYMTNNLIIDHKNSLLKRGEHVKT